MEALSYCKNEHFREILIDDTLKQGWQSEEIREFSSKFNKIEEYINITIAEDYIREKIFQYLEYSRSLLFGQNNLKKIEKEIDFLYKKEKEKDNLIKENLIEDFQEKYKENLITREDAYKLSQESQELQELVFEEYKKNFYGNYIDI